MAHTRNNMVDTLKRSVTSETVEAFAGHGFQSLVDKKQAKGIFEAELNAFFKREFPEDYFGLQVTETKHHLEVILFVANALTVFGHRGERVRQLTNILRQRFHFPDGYLELYPQMTRNRALNAVVWSQALRHKLVVECLPVHRACQEVTNSIMRAGAMGCEVIVSGKLRGQRAKSVKMVEGHLLHSGQGAIDCVSSSVDHCVLPQGVLGLKVRITLPYDPMGQRGCRSLRPDQVFILEPEQEKPPRRPYSQHFPQPGDSAKHNSAPPQGRQGSWSQTSQGHRKGQGPRQVSGQAGGEGQQGDRHRSPPDDQGWQQPQGRQNRRRRRYQLQTNVDRSFPRQSQTR